MPSADSRRFLLGFCTAAAVPLAAIVLFGFAIAAVLGKVGPVRGAASGGTATAAERPAKAPGAETLALAWAGDITPGSVYGTLPGPGRSLYSAVRPRLAGHDVAIGNLEGTLGDQGIPKCPMGTPNCYAFRAPAAAAEGLKWAGFDVLNLANNHSFDYGPEAQVATLKALGEAQVVPAGLPDRVQVLKRRGVRIAVVGFSTYRWTTAMTDPTAVRTLVRRAAGLGDVVVVLFHGGAEGTDKAVTPPGPEDYLGEPRGDVRAFARQAIDAGADVILGSGPHVLRGMEVYRDRLIAYSLGNFAGVKNFSTAGTLRLSALLSLRVDRDGVFRQGYLHPMVLDASGRPTVDPEAEATDFVREQSVRDFPGTAVRIAPNGKLLPPAS